MKLPIKEIFIFYVFILTGCSSNELVKSKTTDDSYYFSSVKAVCNIRIKNNDYCHCLSGVITKNTPASVQKDLFTAPHQAQAAMTKIMLQQMDNIQASCNSYIKEDLSIPSFDVSPLLNKTLKKYENDLLSPSTVSELQPLEKTAGWKFRLLQLKETELTHGVFVLKGEKNGEYFFDYSDITSSPPKVTAKYKWKDGYRYYLKKNITPMKYTMSGKESCKFTVGKCEFEAYNGEKRYIYTEYRNGMWIRNVPASRLNRSLSIDVYDSKGFPVYHLYKNLRNGNSYEERRVESEPNK